MNLKYIIQLFLRYQAMILLDFGEKWEASHGGVASLGGKICYVIFGGT
jgi:hypothetical protein